MDEKCNYWWFLSNCWQHKVSSLLCVWTEISRNVSTDQLEVHPFQIPFPVQFVRACQRGSISVVGFTGVLACFITGRMDGVAHDQHRIEMTCGANTFAPCPKEGVAIVLGVSPVSRCYDGDGQHSLHLTRSHSGKKCLFVWPPSWPGVFCDITKQDHNALQRIRNILPIFVCESLIFFRLLSDNNLEGISTMRIYCPKVTQQTTSTPQWMHFFIKYPIVNINNILKSILKINFWSRKNICGKRKIVLFFFVYKK